MGTSQPCGQCLGSERKPRLREISPQVWSILLSWKEVPERAVNQPLCDICYHDIREILIDRSIEMEAALRTGRVEAPSRKSGASRDLPAAQSTRRGKAAATKKSTAASGKKKIQKVGRIAS